MNVPGYKVELTANSFTTKDRTYVKGFKALIPANNPDVAFFKSHPGVFKMTDTQVSVEEKEPEKVGAPSEEKKPDTPLSLSDIGMDELIVAALRENGITSIEQISSLLFECSDEESAIQALTQLTGIGESRATQIVAALSEHLQKSKEGGE